MHLLLTNQALVASNEGPFATYPADFAGHLRSIAVVVREIERGPTRGAFARAARSLHVDVSVLRRRVKTLEEAVGQELLVGRSPSLAPTDAARELTALAGRIAADAAQVFARIAQAAPRLVLGCTGTITTGLMPAVLSELTAAFPGIELRVRRAGSQMCKELLLRGEIDVGVLRSELRPTELASKRIAADRLSIVVPKDHPLAKGRLDTAAIARHPLVSYGEGSHTGRRVLDRLAPLGARVKLEVDNKAAAIAYAARGFGVAVVSWLPADGAPVTPKGVVAREVTSLFRPVWFYAVWDASREPSPCARHALQLLASRGGANG